MAISAGPFDNRYRLHIGPDGNSSNDRNRPIADISADLHHDSMKGKLSFAERVGRSYRRDPFFSMWGRGALLVFMALLLLLAQLGGRSEFVLWLGLVLTLAFLVWIGLVLKWSRMNFLRRLGQRRRRTSERDAADHG